MATILLAEDNEAVRLLTQAKLRHQFTVVTAANGRETLDILNRQHVDLIVADVMMPVMDGYQLVRTLRAEGNEIPVLFLTALQSMDSKREGFSSMGMTPEVQSHIFEKYYQGAAEDKKQGLGLGLSIVHRIIELTEGRIEVDSQPQQGSSFTVYLPLNQKGA